MNKIFFAAITISSFICASESPSLSPLPSPRHIKTNVSTKKNESKKIDVDEILQSTKSNKSISTVARVRKQSLGSDDFIKEEKMTEKTLNTFNRSRSGTK